MKMTLSEIVKKLKELDSKDPKNKYHYYAFSANFLGGFLTCNRKRTGINCSFIPPEPITEDDRISADKFDELVHGLFEFLDCSENIGKYGAGYNKAIKDIHRYLIKNKIEPLYELTEDGRNLWPGWKTEPMTEAHFASGPCSGQIDFRVAIGCGLIRRVKPLDYKKMWEQLKKIAEEKTMTNILAYMLDIKEKQK